MCKVRTEAVHVCNRTKYVKLGDSYEPLKAPAPKQVWRGESQVLETKQVTPLKFHLN